MPDRLTPDGDDGRPRPLRVAIVGLGPKGMFALERLLDHASRSDPAARIEVDAFEPDPSPGAGPVYDPRQPAHLRMNFAAGQIDMWWPGGSGVPAPQRRSFVTWSHDRGRSCDPAAYPPRAEVGRYLTDGLRRLLAHAPVNVAVSIRPARVRTIGRVESGWALEVDGQPGPDAESRWPAPGGPRAETGAPEWSSQPYDEVLIATGHDRSGPGSLATRWRAPTPLVPAVFPVERWLTAERITPGATVAVRGFALSFIDAALELTEGRGGRFEPLDDGRRQCPEDDGSLPPETVRLRYHPAEDDRIVILPFSRTGRPMLAKPGPALAGATPALEAIAERGRRRIAGLGGDVRLGRDLLPILADAAQATLSVVGNDVAAGEIVERWLERAAAGAPLDVGDAPAVELATSIDVGCGRRTPDLAWALGQTWRVLYPAVVAGLGGNRLVAADWPAFRCLAAELERVSFGPPPLNAAKLLALIDAGRVDLTHVRGGRLVSVGRRTLLRSAAGEQPVDVVLDAVLPGPGAGLGGDGVLACLVAGGHARVAPGRRGIEVTDEGSARRADGSLTPGLAAIGRPTEDSVIGNDTLSRTLHPLSDRWARRVVRRARRQARTPLLAGVAAPRDGAAG